MAFLRGGPRELHLLRVPGPHPDGQLVPGQPPAGGHVPAHPRRGVHALHRPQRARRRRRGAGARPPAQWHQVLHLGRLGARQVHAGLPGGRRQEAGRLRGAAGGSGPHPDADLPRAPPLRQAVDGVVQELPGGLRHPHGRGLLGRGGPGGPVDPERGGHAPRGRAGPGRLLRGPRHPARLCAGARAGLGGPGRAAAGSPAGPGPEVLAAHGPAEPAVPGGAALGGAGDARHLLRALAGPPAAVLPDLGPLDGPAPGQCRQARHDVAARTAPGHLPGGEGRPGGAAGPAGPVAAAQAQPRRGPLPGRAAAVPRGGLGALPGGLGRRRGPGRGRPGTT
mmetsp:Transcript_1217/g.1613  ORF Transcript_1217/g.1613 Transcript_1217/m.1613 type:complete len:336 (+) Transcript_1217:617-1624(+)